MRVVKIEKDIDYKPISCAFHDHLEHYSTLREQVTIVFTDKGSQRTLEGIRILDIIGGRDGEFIQFVHSGMEMLVRLDSIVAVNDKALADFNQC
ncbi:MAG: hypothetical protein MI810_06905 [Flavobacteriales bacterium]|jgi:transcriptional antiterminator Rof (Rho-off)|nr:hypothetical protein [Flavobacteriales bacterium]